MYTYNFAMNTIKSFISFRRAAKVSQASSNPLESFWCSITSLATSSIQRMEITSENLRTLQFYLFDDFRLKCTHITSPCHLVICFIQQSSKCVPSFIKSVRIVMLLNYLPSDLFNSKNVNTKWKPANFVVISLWWFQT